MSYRSCNLLIFVYLLFVYVDVYTAHYVHSSKQCKYIEQAVRRPHSFMPGRDNVLHARAAASAPFFLFIYYNLLSIMFNDFVCEPVSWLTKASGAERCQQSDRGKFML